MFALTAIKANCLIIFFKAALKSLYLDKFIIMNIINLINAKNNFKRSKMSVIKKLWDAEENKDLSQFNEVMSEDFTWVKHSTGEEIGRDVLATWFMSDDAPKSENNRIIYENDEIGVAHSFVIFKDGSRQAVMVVYTIKDGKIIRSETGATDIPK